MEETIRMLAVELIMETLPKERDEGWLLEYWKCKSVYKILNDWYLSWE